MAATPSSCPITHPRLLRIQFQAWILLCVCSAFAPPVPAQDKTVYKIPPKPRPASLVTLAPGSNYALIADKSTQTLLVYDTDFKRVRTFPITTGKVKGEKTRRNDLKTPEGVYFFTNVLEKKELADQFGFMALTTNYPNMVDHFQQKTGDGIWLHAVDFRNNGIRQFDTKGCIAAANQDVLEIARFVTLEETPLIIVERMAYESPERLVDEERTIRALLDAWKSAREGRDIEAYLSLYANEASLMGMDRGEMGEDIRQTIKEYEFIRLNLENIQILNHGSYVVVNCVQDLQTSRFRNQGVKRFYLVRQDGAWKILREEWRERSLKRPSETAGKLVQLVTQKDPETGVNREGWFLAQDPVRYAIQLVGVSSRERLTQYIRENKLSRHVGFFQTSHEGQDWFVVVYGNYKDAPEARAARDRLPENLSNAAPWIRSFQSIQDSIIALYQ